jgi:predicted DNA-binding transcriptional regulator YafY
MINTAPETLKRQWQMLRLIPRHPKHITATEMQQQLEREQFTVTKRTVERDLQALSAVFPLRLDERSKPFGWSWKEDATNFNVPGLSDNEALTFVMVEQHLKSLLPASTLAQLQSYFKEAKIHLSDIKQQNKRMPSWLDKVRTVPPAQPLLPSAVNSSVQQAVYGALLADKQIDIDYMKRGEDKKSCYRVHPLAIVQRGPVSYLCCHINGAERTRTFALHRIKSVAALDDLVEIPAGFSIDEFIASGEFGFGNGKQIRLEAVFQYGAGDHLLETPISSDQILTELGDGTVKLKATVAETQQLVWWLLGLGAGVEVIKPISLRNTLASTIAEMSQIYTHKA